jgi:hypothetical protein
MSYELLQELTEGKTIKSISDFKKYNARDLSTMIFLYLLAIQVMRKSFYKKHFTMTYAEQVLHTNFKGFNNIKNDFALLLYVFMANDNEPIIAKLKDQKESRLFINSVKIDKTQLRAYFTRLHAGEDENDLDSVFLYTMEKKLGIEESNYKSLRRLLVDWDKETHQQKKLTTTRLLQAMRYRFPIQDEVRKNFEEWASKEKMEVDVPCNAETGKCKKPSTFVSTLIGAILGGTVGGK